MFHALGLLLICVAISGQAAPQPDSDEQIAVRFREAQQDLQAGRIDRAVAGFQEVLRLRPDLVPARFNLGLAYFTSGAYARAAKELERVLAIEPELGPAHLFLGLSYVKLGAARKALAPLLRAVRADGSNIEARRALAACYLSLRRYREAVEQHRAVFALERDRESAWFNLGQSYLELTRQLTERMAFDFRTSSWAHRLAADVFAERSLWNDAEEQYRKAFAMDPAQPGLQAALASVLLRAGKREDALREGAEPDQSGPRAAGTVANEAELAERALGPGCAARDDKSCVSYLRAKRALQPEERLLLGRVLLRTGDAERASDEFATVLQDHPDHVEALYWATLTFMRLSDRSFTELLTALPDSPRTHQLRAESHSVRGAYEEAAGEYQAALRLRPDDAELWEALGALYLTLNSTDEAREALQAAERLNPTGGKTQYLLGRVYLAKENPAQATRHLEKAVRYAPNLLEARAALGRVYVRSGKPAQAIPELKSAALLDHYGDLHYLLFRCHTALGQRELAAQALVRSRELRKKAFAGDRAKLAELNPVPPEPEP